MFRCVHVSLVFISSSVHGSLFTSLSSLCKAAAVPVWVYGFLQVWFFPHMLLRVGQPDHRAALFVYINAF